MPGENGSPQQHSKWELVVRVVIVVVVVTAFFMWFHGPRPLRLGFSLTPIEEYRQALQGNRVQSVFVEGLSGGGAKWQWTERVTDSAGRAVIIEKEIASIPDDLKDRWLQELASQYPSVKVKIKNAPRPAVQKEISYSEFLGYVGLGTVSWVKIREDAVVGLLRGSTDTFIVRTKGVLSDALIMQLHSAGAGITFEPKSQMSPGSRRMGDMWLLIGVVLLFLFLSAIVRRSAQPGGRGVDFGAFGKSLARRRESDTTRITFANVANQEEAKEELGEIIDFLKRPNDFRAIGAKIPRGVLLVGPPGNGKTLLAKAVAGEAGVSFFSISGSEFVEMYVGVGASRVRDLFDKAKKSVPCIVFIDELDAVGRQRGSALSGHEEREQTLNQLLVEMDGFDEATAIVVVAATNRPDILDKALIRTGRFDRRIIVDAYDTKGRRAILEIHTREKKLAPDFNLDVLARRTPGFSGSDLATMVNEAALLARRRGKAAIELSDALEALERVIAGPQRKSRVEEMIRVQGRRTAVHEAGHALTAFIDENADKPQRVTITPRGQAVGYVISTPPEDRISYTKMELIAKVKVALAGRAAESIVFFPELEASGKENPHEEDVFSTGAQNDLTVATDIARQMVELFGMSRKLPNVSLVDPGGEVFLGRDMRSTSHLSEATKHIVEEEVREIIANCYRKAKRELEAHKEELKRLVDALLERRVLEGEDIKRAIEDQLPPLSPEDRPLI